MNSLLGFLFGRFKVERSPVRKDPVESPVRIEFTAPIAVYDCEAPEFSPGSAPVSAEIRDPDRLRKVQLAASDEWFCDPMADDRQMSAIASVLSGGKLTFTYEPEPNAVRLHVTFGAARPLVDAERAALQDFVHGQLLDGIGEGFKQGYASGRSHQEQQRGLGSRMWLGFDRLKVSDLELRVTDSRTGVSLPGTTHPK
jgi:hypothetical protein